MIDHLGYPFTPPAYTRTWVPIHQPADHPGAMPTEFSASMWRGLSDEARAAAALVGDENLRIQILLVAARYMVLAKRAERLAAAGSPSSERQKNTD